ncbi:MAG: efflux RND transporter periplasmic adaptor subunit [Candidatus Acidiferrales bacterium]|jgi:RND family efflux transporter MFP subunit
MPKPPIHRWIFTMIILSAFTGGCGDARKADASDVPRAAVVKVQRKNISSTLEIASEFLPYQEIDVYAKVSGYIQKLYVDWGTHVKQGQLLAVLEIPELQQQLLQDEASVRRADQEVSRAREEQSRAESAYSVAHVTYQRLADVQKSRPELVAQQEIDVAQGKDLEASAGVSSSKDALAAAEQALLAAKAALDKDKALFAYARMTAPFDGVVTQIYAYTGALLPAGTSATKGDSALCHLSQNNLLRLVIPVPERAVPDISDGETLEINVSALHKTFAGKIIRFSDQIDPATRTMHTEVTVPNVNYELVPGMYASVKIPLHTVTNVLTIPMQAVQSIGTGEGIVLVVNSSNHLERREVKLGLQSASDTEVLSGVNENDTVIFGEQNQFKEGQQVLPQLVTAPGME